LLRDTYQAVTADHALQRMLWLDWKQTLADNDLRKVSVMTQSAGIQVRYPMLDDALIDLALQLPPDWLLPGQKLRHFYKQAFSDFLPQQILTKPKHGFGLPFGVWMRDAPRLRELAYDALASLKKRTVLRSDYLDQVVQLHQHDHAAYYGESIWIYMMLELWLQAWHD
ncbi:MAG TPA: asparagine synthase-related protein, partial [Pseudomonadales bacterium]|nr:asparagine synthase-related protein [Pseudomonadales bacterium]